MRWFKYIIIIAFFIIGCNSNSPAFDSITTSGTIYKDETWSGVVNITGDIHIPYGVTLTIKPGTQVIMKANYDDTRVGGEHIIDEATDIDPSATPEYTKTHINFNILGGLYAIGEPDNPIIFTSDAKEPKHTDWDGMTFEKNSEGILKYVIVEYSHTGPALHGTNKVNISHSIIRHIFWGGLHAFENSPTFEYNVLYDIGHEAFDTHKASPIIRFNNISNARTAFVFNYYNHASKNPILFENNIVKDSSSMGQLQENAFVIIRKNTFIGSDNTGGPWHYKGFTLDSEVHSRCLALADNVNVEIVNNIFSNFEGSAICYEKIGPNKGIGHTTNIPEPFEIIGPIKIWIKNNIFNGSDDLEFLNELTAWENVEVTNNYYAHI